MTDAQADQAAKRIEREAFSLIAAINEAPAPLQTAVAIGVLGTVLGTVARAWDRPAILFEVLRLAERIYGLPDAEATDPAAATSPQPQQEPAYAQL